MPEESADALSGNVSDTSDVSVPIIIEDERCCVKPLKSALKTTAPSRISGTKLKVQFDEKRNVLFEDKTNNDEPVIVNGNNHANNNAINGINGMPEKPVDEKPVAAPRAKPPPVVLRTIDLTPNTTTNDLPDQVVTLSPPDGYKDLHELYVFDDDGEFYSLSLLCILRIITATICEGKTKVTDS
jgi:hypothetical protein